LASLEPFVSIYEYYTHIRNHILPPIAIRRVKPDLAFLRGSFPRNRARTHGASIAR